MGLTLVLNLCCLVVCAIQFLFAVKLVKSTHGRHRTNKYLKGAASTRVCAIAGFFVSIPLFLTGVVLYTFLHFDSTPAIVSAVLIGLGILFCGGAVVHNVFVWQKVNIPNDLLLTPFFSIQIQDSFTFKVYIICEGQKI